MLNSTNFNVNSENVNAKLQFLMEKTRKFATKNHERIMETKWTLFFLITSTIQAILAIVLEARILTRNFNAQNGFLTQYQSQDESETCGNNTLNRMENIKGENVIFILFNIFQLWFSYNAIYNQNVIQLVTIAVVNYIVGIVAIVQIVEINKWRLEAMACVEAYKFENKYARYEVPLIVVSLVSATTMVYFTWKLYQQFGWNIYKKIGADLKMQSIYKTMLIFAMLLKLDIFFMIVLAIEALTVFKFKLTDNDNNNSRFLQPSMYFFHVSVTILIIFLLALAFRSLRQESKKGMKIFIITWLIAIADFIMILKFSIRSANEDSWFFFICYITSGIAMSLLTLIWAALALKNFGLGLKKHINREPEVTTLPQHAIVQLPKPTDQSIPGPLQMSPIPNTRWAIDDDD